MTTRLAMMAASALVLGGCATSDVDLSRPATPVEQAMWARSIIENYPSRALRQMQEGRVGVAVTVGELGRVTGCRITRSSGFPILDEAACRNMERYARFEPALDRDGDPTEGSWSTSIVYQIN